MRASGYRPEVTLREHAMTIAITGKTAEKRDASSKRPPRRVTAARAKQLFQELVDSPLSDMARDVRRGLPAQMVDDAADFLQVPKSEIMAITEVKAASLSRWTREGQMLPLGESDRLARVARVARVARQVLGSDEEAVLWLNTPVPALGNVKPLSLLTSDASSRIVEDTLARAAAGVYA
jgi:putative toxin-antitoxin system antitoxin component (TIGR02293 family)